MSKDDDVTFDSNNLLLRARCGTRTLVTNIIVTETYRQMAKYGVFLKRFPVQLTEFRRPANTVGSEQKHAVPAIK